MMKDQFANYVVQKVLEVSNDRQRELLLNRIRVHLNALKKYTYGKHIAARFEQLLDEGAGILLYLHLFLSMFPFFIFLTNCIPDAESDTSEH